MVKKEYVPDRLDVIWIDLNPTRGHEQSNTRPIIVLTTKAYNKRLGLLVGCSITSHIKGYPFEVQIDEKKVHGVVLADQVRSMDWRNRRLKFIQKAPQHIFEEVERKIKMLLFG